MSEYGKRVFAPLLRGRAMLAQREMPAGFIAIHQKLHTVLRRLASPYKYVLSSATRLV